MPLKIAVRKIPAPQEIRVAGQRRKYKFRAALSFKKAETVIYQIFTFLTAPIIS